MTAYSKFPILYACSLRNSLIKGETSKAGIIGPIVALIVVFVMFYLLLKDKFYCCIALASMVDPP